MIGSAATRAAFIASAKTFLTTYELDGIGAFITKYPGAIERDAPATDTPNLTQFFTDLRAALPSAIISCGADAAGYWFLKGFEIDLIVKSVDYLNMMSYDYHGPWDTNVRDQASVASPHTLLADMKVSTLLYTRVGIDLSKGLAWYGRTYRLADAACKGYNCTMTSGGAPGKCSGASGYLTQFEITDLLSGGVQPTLDAASETYWFETGADLITFDQADTWAIQSRVDMGLWVRGVVDIDGGAAGPSVVGTLPTSVGIVGDPNPYPNPTAPSETFACSGTTTSLAIPVETTTISVGGATIVLNSGGTPVNEPLSSQCTEIGGIFPTWSLDILPPPGAATITFTGPLTGTPTWLTTVPVPPKTDSPVVTVIGPPGDKPPGWTGQWTNPIPRPTPTLTPDGTKTDTTSQSSSSTSTACPAKPLRSAR
ncbi:glycosyl hydrolases family 18-domain-containing protein [Mycena sp. CBHHK59/15]|nr:glycosyl hydrolases family 18-domain-containing protein [Mycena sp. CBHHK59/15]